MPAHDDPQGALHFPAADDAAASDSAVCVLDLPFSEAAALVPAGIEALSTALRDPQIRVVVLRGDATFGLGLDQALPGDPALADALHDWVLALHQADKPMIAAVEHRAGAAGLALALACDILVAARGAQLLLPAAGELAGHHAGALGLAASRLPQTALNAWLLGDGVLSAERAHALGLVTQLAPAGMAGPQAEQLAATVASRDTAELNALKAALEQARQCSLAQLLQHERARWMRRATA